MQTPKVKDEWIVELRLARLVSFANFTESLCPAPYSICRQFLVLIKTHPAPTFQPCRGLITGLTSTTVYTNK